MTAYGQHHFSRSENLIVRLRTQNEVMANAINDVMLRINDVTPCGVNDLGLRPTILHFVQKYDMVEAQ